MSYFSSLLLTISDWTLLFWRKKSSFPPSLVGKVSDQCRLLKIQNILEENFFITSYCLMWFRTALTFVDVLFFVKGKKLLKIMKKTQNCCDSCGKSCSEWLRPIGWCRNSKNINGTHTENYRQNFFFTVFISKAIKLYI